MASKRKSDSDGNQTKKARKTLSLETKLNVIKQHEEGKKIISIARDLQLSHSTVSTILKNKDRIKEAVKAAAPMKSTIITKQREGPIAEMEKMLFTWLEDNRQRNVQVMLQAVQSKATSLFRMLKERGGEEYASLKFIASAGWFRRFRERYQVMPETMKPYKEIYEEKKKRMIQTSLSMFVKRTPKPASSTIDATPSPASTSGYQRIPPTA